MMNIKTDLSVNSTRNSNLAYYIIGFHFTRNILDNLKLELVAVSDTAHMVETFHPKKLIITVDAVAETLTKDILQFTSAVSENGVHLKFLDDTIICVSDFIYLLQNTLSALQNGTYIKKLDVFQLLPTAKEVLTFFYSTCFSPDELYEADDLLASVIALANEYRNHKNFLPKQKANSHHSIYGSMVAV